LFIVSCGLTHLMEVWVIWDPLYWLSGYVKVIAAAASLSTAIALFPLVPKVFRLIDAARASEARRIEIEQLNRDLETFNSSVAHDLRSPLRGIKGYADVIEEDHAGRLPPDVLAHLARIQNAATRMDSLIGDLLQYAKVGAQPLAHKPVLLKEPLDAALAMLDSEINRLAARIIVPRTLPAVVGDPTLLQVIFQNLLANSLKFVPEGVQPRVEIAVEPASSDVTVSVTDNGIGIPVEHRERVFRIFERVSGDRPGAGVGLALVSRAVSRLQGTIAISDGPGGRGTRFSVRLKRP
jgi:signal transduction histidine kinase